VKHKKDLVTLCRKKLPLKERRRIFMKQSGGAGFLLPIISAAIPAITSLVSALIKKNGV
jgi:hypothetical protein